MDHPLRSEDLIDLRRRVVSFLKGAYHVARSSNIVFVCGGNDPHHMRTKFRNFCSQTNQDFEVFLPESAMRSIFADPDDEPFDIADFEELVGVLSHAIVVFPEAAGSFAETGYFSAVVPLARRTILVLNSQYQALDSFISLGPARKINIASKFHPNIQIDYTNPNFEPVIARIRRIARPTTKKSLNLEPFSEVSDFEHFCVIHEIVRLLRIATPSDIFYILRAVAKNKISIPKSKKLISILVGSGYFHEVGGYGHLKIDETKRPLLEPKQGYRSLEASLKLELASILRRLDADILALIEGAGNVD